MHAALTKERGEHAGQKQDGCEHLAQRKPKKWEAFLEAGGEELPEAGAHARKHLAGGRARMRNPAGGARAALAGRSARGRPRGAGRPAGQPAAGLATNGSAMVATGTGGTCSFWSLNLQYGSLLATALGPEVAA